ncbi:hypothetical protein FS837_007845 [Tulasnella sp. UAMH 9824]|nr:hypothetical protein FS837_007845 [Tulasnella sp. UAMH 9824]
MTVTAINSMEEFKIATSSGKVVLIDFESTGSRPCNAISPVFERFSNLEIVRGAAFYKVNVEALVEVSQEVGIKTMPTVMAFKDGQKVDQLVGVHPADLQDFVRIHAASPS